MTVLAETAAPPLVDPDAWLAPVDIATAHRKSKSRIGDALRDGRLHGHQGVFKGRWRVRAAVVDAWISGASPEAQLEACGPHCPDRQARRKASKR